MNVAEYLREKGIRYREVKRPAGMQAIFPCPNCGDKDSFSINLETGIYSCLRQNKCGISGNYWEFRKMQGDEPFIREQKKYSNPVTKPERINEEVYSWFEKRKISPDAVKHFKIGLSGYGNEVLFPYRKDGKLVNIKHRDMKEKRFSKEKDCKSTLWNQDNVKGKTLYILEGEIDCMALFEYGIEGTSLPSGVNDMTWIEQDWDYLEKFETIYLMFDNDQAGQSGIEKLVTRLGKWRCKNIVLPHKDLNECLMNGMAKEDLQGFIDNATEYNMQELKHCDYYVDEIIEYKNNPNKLFGTITSNIKLTEILKGWRNEELSIWTGRNGSGKSTMLSQEIIHLLNQGKKCCIGSFEMPPRKYLWWMTKQALKQQSITDFDVNIILNSFAENLFIIDILGVVNKEDLIEIMKFGSRKYGIEVFVIDSLMKVRLTTKSNEILGEQKNFVSDLKDFVSEFRSHVHLVAHPRKGGSDESAPGSSDVAGSGHITDLADNVFVMYRFTEDQKKDRSAISKEPYDSYLEVKKNREHGELGKIGFYFNKDFKTFTEAQK